MASISTNPAGNRTIQFFDPHDKKRKSIRVGKWTMKRTQEFKAKVECLVSAKASNCIDPVLMNWVNGVGEDLYGKLAAVGLVPDRVNGNITIKEFAAEYIAKRVDIKPQTRLNLQLTANRMAEHFGEDRRLKDVTAGDADEFAAWLKTIQAPATVSRTLRRAIQLYKAAVKKGYVTGNPFASIKCGSQVNSARNHFVTRESAAKIMDACPSLEWKLIFALCRFGGLRCPSEHRKLRWVDIDWANERIKIHSPKKEHLAGGGVRFIPIFPELRALLLESAEQAPEGAVYVVTKQNLRTHFERIVARAGLKKYPRLFQNLRASRETELAAEFPLHVVCQWIGNSAKIAAAHYLSVGDDDFRRAAAGGDRSDKAVQNPVQQVAIIQSQATPIQSQQNEKTPSNLGAFCENPVFSAVCDSEQNSPSGPVGEPKPTASRCLADKQVTSTTTPRILPLETTRINHRSHLGAETR